MNKLVIKLLKYYQRIPKNKSHCRYYPTCSNYSLEAFQKFNFYYAFILTIFRILRCNPLSKGGYDPVPKTRLEKLFIEDYPN